MKSTQTPGQPELLRAYPELQAFADRSEIFRRIAERARVDIDGRAHYLVRGDTLGSRDELLVDALCRGASPESADPPSRALFLELTPELQAAVRRTVRPDP